MPQADFYILSGQTGAAREQFLLRLLEQIQSKGRRILILTDHEEQARGLDQLLWDYRPDAFLPHNMLGDGMNASIQIGAQIPAQHDFQVVINLSSQTEQALSSFSRIVEIVVQEPAVLNVTRQRYQHYRQLDYSLNRHDLRQR